MAFRNNKFIKIGVICSVFLTWSGAMFWVGWKSPQLIGAPFNVSEPAPKIAKFYPLERFVFSISGEDSVHYLLLEMALKSHSEDAANVLVEAEPLIKNTLMKMFSNKNYEELQVNQQLELLQSEAQVSLAQVLQDNHFELDLEAVLFTRMVIQ